MKRWQLWHQPHRRFLCTKFDPPTSINVHEHKLNRPTLPALKVTWSSTKYDAVIVSYLGLVAGFVGSGNLARYDG